MSVHVLSSSSCSASHKLCLLRLELPVNSELVDGALAQPKRWHNQIHAAAAAARLPLPPTPALPLRPLQRLLAHRTAQHWGLETSTVNHGPEQGRILALRTPATRPPQVGSPPNGGQLHKRLCVVRNDGSSAQLG